jgi:hypothetical protein
MDRNWPPDPPEGYQMVDRIEELESSFEEFSWMPWMVRVLLAVSVVGFNLLGFYRVGRFQDTTIGRRIH